MNQFLKTTTLTFAMLLASPCAWAQKVSANTPLDCKAPSTQKQMNDCAYEEFLAANAGYAEGNQFVSSRLSGKQRDLFRRAQTSWAAYRTATCAFESSAVQGGSARGMVNWQCAARMTRARAVELTEIGNCAEGDLACVRIEK